MTSKLDSSSIATGSGDDIELHRDLFPEERLTQLTKWNEINKTLSEKQFLARPLRLSDYKSGYLELLSQLTEVGDISEHEFAERFNRMRRANQVDEHYIIVVIEDIQNKRVVAASTLHLELKFIHKCALRGRLEDVAVLNTHRGHGLGQIIVSIIVELAREAYKCYKLSLDCTDELKKFYSLNNFSYGSNMLCIRFK